MINEGLTAVKENGSTLTLRTATTQPERDVDSLLASLRESTLAVRVGSPTPPNWIKVSVGDVVMEVGWRAGDTTGTEATTTTAPATTAAPVKAGTPDPGVPAPAEPAQPADGLEVIGSPAVGTFYRAPEPGAVPFVEVGDVVVPGQQVATLEVMKLMIPVEATAGGLIAEVLKADATSVEYGEALFTLAPHDVVS